MLICVKYEQNCVHSERESGSYGSWEEQHDSSITEVFEIKEGETRPYRSETFKVPDGTTKVFVVYMIYDTGDSFGRSYGEIDIVHCTADETAAHNLAARITKNPNDYIIEFKDDFGRDISISNTGAGYFERIQYVEVESFAVGSSAKKKRYTVN